MHAVTINVAHILRYINYNVLQCMNYCLIDNPIGSKTNR